MIIPKNFPKDFIKRLVKTERFGWIGNYKGCKLFGIAFMTHSEIFCSEIIKMNDDTVKQPWIKEIDNE